MAEQKRRRSCRRPCRRACRHLHRAHRTGAGAFVPSGPPSGGTFASGLGWAADVSSPVLSPILQRQGQLQRGMVPSKARRGRSARPRTVTSRNRHFQHERAPCRHFFVVRATNPTRWPGGGASPGLGLWGRRRRRSANGRNARWRLRRRNGSFAYRVSVEPRTSLGQRIGTNKETKDSKSTDPLVSGPRL